MAAKNTSKQKINELIRYDYNLIKIVFLPFLWLYACFLSASGQYNKLITFLASGFRFAWPGTFTLAHFFITRVLFHKNKLRKDVFENISDNFLPNESTQRFFDQPEKILNGMLIVVSPKTDTNKGVIIIKYSYYFIFFLQKFNFSDIIKDYYIVLEPSWNGLCEQSVLAFSGLDYPVFVMAYEERDFELLTSINSNLIPIKLSSNWWINDEKFTDNTVERDIDIICISSWSTFKRHAFIFQSLKNLKQKGEIYNITLVGYPGDLTQQDILDLAADYGISQQVTTYEKINPEAVSALLKRSKINIIWSRFEGVNRAIIEGMYCGVPCIVRDGFNFGQKYSYINDETGLFSTEKNLPATIKHILHNFNDYQPREYIREHHNCRLATKMLGDEIKKIDSSFDSSGMLVKCNELDGMTYFNQDDFETSEPDITYFKSKIV